MWGQVTACNNTRAGFLLVPVEDVNLNTSCNTLWGVVMGCEYTLDCPMKSNNREERRYLSETKLYRRSAVVHDKRQQLTFNFAKASFFVAALLVVVFDTQDVLG
eukprot:scaffold800_cov197-Alexandrium_tamarense.AAC.28